MNTAWRIFLTLWVTYAGFGHFYGTTNDATRMALTAAIVDQGTLRIEGQTERFISPAYNPIDYAVYEGRRYSDKAPLGSLLAVPVYAILRQFTDHPGWLGYLITLFFSAAAMAGAGALIYVAGSSFGVSERLRIQAALAFGLGSVAMFYASFFFSHGLTALGLTASFVLLVRARRAESPGRHVFVLAGLCAACAVASDYYAVLPAVVLLGYAVVVDRRGALLWLAGAVGPALAVGLYHWACFDNPFSLPHAHLGRHTSAAHRSGLFGATLPEASVVLELLIGPTAGLFYYSPVMLLAAVMFGVLMKRDRAEGLTCVLSVVLVLLFAAALTNWRGGDAWGPRYLVPVLPLLCVGFFGMPRNPRGMRLTGRLMVGLLGLSAALNLIVANAGVLPAASMDVPLRYALGISGHFGSFGAPAQLLLYDFLYPQPEPRAMAAVLLLLPFAAGIFVIWRTRLAATLAGGGVLFLLVLTLVFPLLRHLGL